MPTILSTVLVFLLAACRSPGGSADPAFLAVFGSPPPETSIDDLAWLAGRWQGEGLGGEVEETWSAPAGGAMVGHFRAVREGTVVFYEIMTLGPFGLAEPGVFGMRVKHFRPDLTGWEEKDATVKFPLRSAAGNVVQFDGLLIRRLSADACEMEVEIKDRDGSVRTEVLRYHRAH